MSIFDKNFDKEDAALVAVILTGLALQIGSFASWHQATSPEFVSGLLLIVAAALRARYKE